jgi:hypothetical protein
MDEHVHSTIIKFRIHRVIATLSYYYFENMQTRRCELREKALDELRSNGETKDNGATKTWRKRNLLNSRRKIN